MKLLTKKGGRHIGATGSARKRTILSAAMAFAFGMIALAPQAFAADGTITFTGTIVDTTCTVKGSGTATNGTFTVALPKVSVGSLATAGNTAGSTPFSLSVGGGVGCKDAKVPSMYVETGDTTNLDAATGYLNNPAGAGAATNVQIRLNKQDGIAINLASNDTKTNNQPAATVTGNSATLNYVAQYVSKGGATAGTVSTTLVYSIQYN